MPCFFLIINLLDILLKGLRINRVRIFFDKFIAGFTLTVVCYCVMITRHRLVSIAALLILVWSSGWGFFGHREINRLAVFTLPPEMIGFYKANIRFLTTAAVNPDRRRYAVPDEAPRHYIDIDHYGDSAFSKIPHSWREAERLFSADTLEAHGIVPWHIYRVYHSLRDAFLLQDPSLILKHSAEIGHYIADANVPLHTTENYDGQKTGQEGIHAFWESRLPELFSHDFDFFVGRAEFVASPLEAAWHAVAVAHEAVDSVLTGERELYERMGHKKFAYETRGRQTTRVVSLPYARAYHRLLSGMVERQMRSAVKMTGDFWYSAWVDAGQPDIQHLINYTPSVEELELRKQELERWRRREVISRQHEVDY